MTAAVHPMSEHTPDLQIVHYPYPTLRRKSKPVRRIDAELRGIIQQMFALMYAAKGVGLAANQVDLPLRLFVVNLKGDPSGQERVFINPIVSRPRGSEEAEEGCLSLPGLYAPVRRPQKVVVAAHDLTGREFQEDVDGLLARVIQHELDHLDGVLFIDRLSDTGRLAAAEAIDDFETDFHSRRATGSVPADTAIAAQWEQWERRYC